jgi:thiol-disulfide isomerase/thioredoxin
MAIMRTSFTDILLRAGATTILVSGLALVACGNSSGGGERPGGNETAANSGTVGASAETAAGKPAIIAHGERVELGDHVVEGEITVFDFTSEYCGPCRQIDPWIERLHEEREGVSVVKVDINRPDVRGIDWGSPVARQYRLNSIPAFKVFDAEGKLMAEGPAAQQLVWSWLIELPERRGS